MAGRTVVGHKRQIALHVASILLLGALLAALSEPAFAKSKPKPSLKVTPSKVAINTKAKITGSHLWANANVTLLIAVPDLQKNAAESFIGQVWRTDKHGNLKASVKMPIVTKCGKATIYVAQFPAKPGAFARTHITLTGCTSAGKGVAPPPPPSGGKKH
jgi:hypothetical protein